MIEPTGQVRRAKRPLWLTIIVLLLAAAGAWLRQGSPAADQAPSPQSDARRSTARQTDVRTSDVPETSTPDDSLPAAIQRRADDVVVRGQGTIVKMLPDDNEGARHQRILVKLSGGATILIAHNIDLAKRLTASEGDAIAFKGIYIWNDRGGVVHWTHRDLSQRHPPGWLRAGGVTVD